ncbi:hypothetical protein TNCV_160511 [Trichonephila clavipes]|nr:hypothetical protein TNCV_160511 [Trichonephila clavipes]
MTRGLNKSRILPRQNGEGGRTPKHERSIEAERRRGEGKNAGKKTGRPKAVNQDDGQNISAVKNSSGRTVVRRSPLTDGKMPCLLRYDWSRPIIAESGRGKGLGRSENKRPETRRSWN